MGMYCKNCNHRICIQGEFSDQLVSHINEGGGYVTICPKCRCDKPQRKTPPVFCHCGAEIYKPKKGHYNKGKWTHIDTYGSGVNSNRPGQAVRLGNIVSLVTGCNNPKPKEGG